MRTFTLKLYDRIIEQYADVEGFADNEERTPVISPAGFYVVIRNFVISEDDNHRLKIFEIGSQLFMQKLLFEKSKQKLILYQECINKIADLNRQEFKLAKEKFSKWNQVRQKFRYADEPLEKIKYLENYIYTSIEWFKKNKIKIPQIKIATENNYPIVSFIWNGKQSQLKKLYDEVIRLKYIDSIDYLEFKSHFILAIDSQNNLPSKKINFIAGENVLVGLIQNLVESGLLPENKKWKKTSQNFLWRGHEITNKALSDLLGSQRNDTNIITEGIIKFLNS